MEDPVSDDPRHQEIRRRIAHLRFTAPDAPVLARAGS
jgi:hypothetical protein